MSVEPIIAVAEEALAFHEALRRLGFRADDIFVGGAPNAEMLGAQITLFVRLRVHGMPEVALSCGQLTEIQLRAFELEWASVVRAWNETMAPEEREKIYAKSFVRSHAGAFIMMLVAKGHTLSPDADTRVVASWWNA